MRLADFVTADHVVVPLESATLPVAAQTLVERLARAGSVSDAARLRERVAEERPEDIVAMGDRAFLLHYRTDTAPDLAVALGTSPTPISRQLGEDGDVQVARILLLVVAPPRVATRYLQVVGAFARFLSKPERVDALLAAGSAEELVALPDFADYAVPEQVTVRDLMTERPRTVGPDSPLREAARDMIRSRLGALPVVDGAGQVVGMLGERELMRHLLDGYLHAGARGGAPHGDAEGSAPAPLAVRDVMTRQVLCVSPDQPIADVASIMTNKDVDRVPVVRDGRLVGFLTRGDIVRKLIGFQ
jgi:CBS domain-containing protein/mannitol/fructose-specific phosphotransferase system IIA component (Ntr-type)